MAKMQQVKFSGVAEFLRYLPEDELEITEALRDLVMSSLSDVKEKLSYNVPYYRRHRNICFIWPGAIYWGKKRGYDGVRMGFTNGHLLTNEDRYLASGNRKFVFWRDFKTVEEIDQNRLKAFLYEALLIDDRWA